MFNIKDFIQQYGDKISNNDYKYNDHSIKFDRDGFFITTPNNIITGYFWIFSTKTFSEQIDDNLKRGTINIELLPFFNTIKRYDKINEFLNDSKQ